MRSLFLIIAAVSLCYGADTTYDSKTYGFSIEPPVVAEHDGIQAAIFFLPAIDGFAANVNVQIQAFADSLEAYDELSGQQFVEMGLTMLNREIGENGITYEYSGELNGRQFHWYSKAMKRGDQVILVTATTLKDRWENDRDTLKSSVDSFKLHGDKKAPQ